MSGSPPSWAAECNTDRIQEALVLRRSDSGESDRRLTLLTRDFGKLDVVAKGARKAGSRLAGSSEPLVFARFGWAEGKHRRFITQVTPVTSFPKIRSDYDRLLVALAYVEVLATSLPYESPSPEYFDLATDSLKHFESCADPGHALTWALVRLLEEEGHGAQFTQTIDTDEPLTWSPAAFHFRSGGIVRHIDDPGGCAILSAEALIGLSRIGMLAAPPAKFNKGFEALRLVIDYWDFLLERPLPACRSLIESLIPHDQPEP